MVLLRARSISLDGEELGAGTVNVEDGVAIINVHGEGVKNGIDKNDYAVSFSRVKLTGLQ